MNEGLGPWYKYSLIAFIAWMLPVLFLKFSGTLEGLSFQGEAWEVLLPGILQLLAFSILSGCIRLPLKYFLLGLFVPVFQWYFYPEMGTYLPVLFYTYLICIEGQKWWGVRTVLFLTGLLYPFTIALLPLLFLNARAAQWKLWYLSSPVLSLMLGFLMSEILNVQFVQQTGQIGMFGSSLELSFGFLLGISLSMFVVLFFVYIMRGKQFFLAGSSHFDRDLLLYPLLIAIGASLSRGTVVDLFDIAWLMLSLFPLLMVYFDSETRYARMVSSFLFVLMSGGLFYADVEWFMLLAIGLSGVLYSFFWSLNRRWLTLGLLVFLGYCFLVGFMFC